MDFDANIAKIRDGLVRHAPDIGHYRFFRVHDPKPRDICAASFPERVLHHAVMNVCEPVLEAYAVFDSYACRKGKGNLKALNRARVFSNRFPWYLKLDIRKYFDSIDHDVLLRLLSRRFKDRSLMALFEQLLNTYHTRPGKGMPIGNLISQHLANFYLGSFDHWIKEARRVPGYLRYMDDTLCFGPDRKYLNAELDAIRGFLKRELALDLKENIQLNRCRNGIPFLGFRGFPDRIRLSPMSRKRFANKFIEYERRWQDGVWSQAELVRHMEPLIAFTQLAGARSFRRNVIQRFGVSS
jgi:RNA-directed DNA polymerase